MDESELVSRIASLSSAISSRKQVVTTGGGVGATASGGADEKERLLMQQIARLSEEINRKKKKRPASTFSTATSTFTSHAPPCRFFHSYGHCDKGLNCAFSHETPVVASTWGGGRGRGGFAPRGGGRGGRGRGRGGPGFGFGSEGGAPPMQRTTTTTTSAGQSRAEDDDKAKTLPVCFRFLLGSCSDAQCPYPHVNVNPRAAVCEAFLAGYCPQGSACKLLHTYECQAWVRTGECDDPQCRFKHPRNVRGRQRVASDESAPSIGLATSSLPPLSSSIVVSNEQRREVDGSKEDEDEEEASDDGRSRFRGTRDDDEEDGSNSDSASGDEHEAKRRKVDALPDVLSGSIVPRFGAAVSPPS